MFNSRENEIKNATIHFRYFSAITEKPQEFIKELEQLCKEYCDLGDFFSKYSIDE